MTTETTETRLWIGTCVTEIRVGMTTEGVHEQGSPEDELLLPCPLHKDEVLRLRRVGTDEYNEFMSDEE